MSIATKPLVARTFADLPTLLTQAGRADLVPAEVSASIPAAAPVELRVPAGLCDPPLAQAGVDGQAPANAGDGLDDSDLSTLLADLEAAHQTLATLLAQDEQERRSA